MLCLLATAWPAAHADVTIFVQAASAPNLHVFDTNGTCTGTNSGTAFNSYTTWPGVAMNKSVTTSDGKTWFYEVFTGLNSASVILNNGSSQTDDITGVSGTKYYYYNGTDTYIDLTSCKDYNSYCFLQTSYNYWEQASATFQVWDGSADVNMTQVGSVRNSGKIYLYRKVSAVTDGTTFYFKRLAANYGTKWNEASSAYHIGYLYTNNGWSSVSSASLTGSIVWPEVPAAASTYTVAGVASPAAGGTVTPASATELESGESVTLTATPADGYQFAGWTISGTSTYTENGSSVTVTVGTSNVTATANFTATPKSYTIHVIDYYGATPYLYAWDDINGDLLEGFPGALMTDTETSAAGETWYKKTLSSTASTISVIASLGDNTTQTPDITGIAPGDYYIVFDGSTKTIKYQSTTMPEGKQQAAKKSFTVYVRADAAPYIYTWEPELNGEWHGTQMSETDTEPLADDNAWYKVTYETYAESINFVLNDGGSNQGADITQTDPVAYYYYDGATDARRVIEPTGKMYVIGQVGGNPWSTNAGMEMTDNGNGTFSLKKVQIIAGASFAFATQLAAEDDWDALNAHRLTSTANGDFWAVTTTMTDRDAPMALSLQAWNGTDKNFVMDETAYYDITFDTKTWKVTITRDFDALYMFYGGSESPYWKPNAGVPMLTTDGETYTLTGVALEEGDTFQFASQLGSDENTWPANDDRLGADAEGTKWLVTAEEIGIVLENALQAGSTKDFEMQEGTAGTYRVVVNPEARTVALYKMAEVLGSKMIIHLEQTSNVATPMLWAYDKERDKYDEYYIHEDRPARNEIATNRHALKVNEDPNQAKELTTADGRKWWTWEVDRAICDFWFTRNGYDYESVKATALTNADMTDIQWRKAGEIFLTWQESGTAMNEYTRDYYAAAAQEAADCAVMIEGHEYAYFTNTPGWAHVFCHAWYTDEQGENHDLLTPPAPYEGNPCYPGALCELVGYDKDGYEVWRIDLTAAGITQYPNGGILFNNGIDDLHDMGHDLNHDYYNGTGTTAAKEQSGDFAYSTGTCYDYCGVIVLGRSLGNIIRNGVVNGPVYTIEEDLVGVYFDPLAVTTVMVDNVPVTLYGALYCKDMNNFVTTQYVDKSLQQEGQVDYMREYYTFYGTQHEQFPTRPDRYDQSNWVKLTISTQYPGYDDVEGNKDAQLALLSSYVGKVLPAESVRGQLVNNFNPEMHLALQALPDAATLADNNYKDNPNVFITSSFIGSQKGIDPYGTEYDMFFVTPKPQEYADITWALYNGNNEFVVCNRNTYDYDVDGNKYYMNGFDLKGYFKVQWDMQENVALEAGQLYQFKGIIRLIDTDAQSGTTNDISYPRRAVTVTPKEDNATSSRYIVSPINLEATTSIITGVNDLTDGNVTFKKVESVEYVDVTGKVSNQPFDGINIVVTHFTDGTVSTHKVIR